jgi:hypothetical protein
MVNKRIFSISDELFSYYRTEIDLDEVNNLNDIKIKVISNLRKTLRDNNLEQLEKKLLEKNFHIHGYTFENVLLSEPDQIYYVCGHCQSENSNSDSETGVKLSHS